MLRWRWILLAFLLSACAVEDRAEVPQPPPQVITVFLPPAQQCVEVVQLPPLPLPPQPVATRRKAAPKSVPPGQLITEAHQDARIAPTRQGYFGGTAEYTYTWVPGKIFAIYLQQGQPTSIRFPKGDFITQQFFPNEKFFQVVPQRIGSEQTGYDVITVVPLIERGEWETFVLGDSGRKYNLHLRVGERGMLGVAFETPPLYREEPPRLPLPKPLDWPHS